MVASARRFSRKASAYPEIVDEDSDHDNVWCPINFAFCVVQDESRLDLSDPSSPKGSPRGSPRRSRSLDYSRRNSKSESDFSQPLEGSVRQVYVSAVKGLRNSMEDMHDIKTSINGDPDVAAFAVFDGHCGSKASEFCKGCLLDNTIQNHNFQTDIQLALEESMEYVGDEFSIKAIRQGWRDGTTAVAAVMQRGMLVVGNIGDSRAVLGRSNGNEVEAVDLSRDHKPSDADEKRRIYEMGGLVAKSLAEAQMPLQSNKLRRKWMQMKPSGRNADAPDRAYPGGLSVSRSIGDVNIKKEKDGVIIQTPEMRAIKMLPHDEFLILACDGLWDVLSSTDACNAVAKSLSLGGDPADSLTSLGLRKGSTDNISAVVVAFDISKLRGKSILKNPNEKIPLNLKRRVSFASDTKGYQAQRLQRTQTPRRSSDRSSSPLPPQRSPDGGKSRSLSPKPGSPNRGSPNKRRSPKSNRSNLTKTDSNRSM